MDYEYLETGNRKPFRRRFRLVNLLKVFGGVFILVLLIEAISILIGNLSVKPVVARWGVIEKGFWTEALFLRNETLITASNSGDINLLLADGTRVPAGEIIANIKTNQSSTPPSSGVNIEAKLIQLKQERQFLTDNYQQILNEISRKRAQLKKVPKNSKKIQGIDEAVALLEQEKARALRNIHYNELKIQQLIKNSTEPRDTFSIVVDKPGYLYYQTDGWEGRFGINALTGLTPADFERSYILKPIPKQVKEGETVGKLINPFKQTIAFLADTEQTGIPAVGDAWKYRIGERIFQSTVQQRIPLTERKMVIGLEDTFFPEESMPNRRARIFIIYRYMSGVVIPVQALFQKDRETVVRIVKGDGFREEKVSVIETDGVQAIVTGIKFGTTIFTR